MRKAILLVCVVGVASSLLGIGNSARARPTGPNPLTTSQRLPIGVDKIAPEVRTALASAGEGEMISVIVTLTDQADLSQIPGASRAARQQGVIRALQAKAQASQQRITTLLAVRQSQGLVGQFTAFWVFNGLAISALPATVQELAARDDVHTITPDQISIVPAHVNGDPEPNLSIVNAPALWALDLSGQGIVVANLDSGVDVTHPDLSGRWRGGTNSWFDPHGEHPNTPTDLSGHGTWTMGVMLGGEAGGTALGVAPEAQWIAVKIFDDQGGSTASAIHQGYEWLLDPDGNPTTADAPWVVNNSWTFAYSGCNLEFELDLQSLRAAGILPVFAAGNGGPGPQTSYSPANNPSAFAVGATDNSDLIYSYSSRGPSSCGEPTSVFPELVAPGVGIRTTDLYGSYYDATGTSLAAPHVAGALALLLSGHPNLTVAQQEAALLYGAVDLGPLGLDNVYGWGRLDALAAYNWLMGSTQLSITQHDTPDPVGTGETLTYTLAIANTGPHAATAVTVTDELPPEVTYGGASGAGWSCTQSEGMVSCSRPSLGVGVAPRIVITATAPMSAGTITNTAAVTSTTTDPSPADNHVTEQTTVIPPGVAQADLSVAKMDSVDPVEAGTTLTYTLVVTNAGPDPAIAVTVTDELPDGMTYGGASGAGWGCGHIGGVVTCTQPSLAVGVAPSITLTVTTPASAGTITNSVWVSSTTTDVDRTNNVHSEQTTLTPPVPEADLKIAKLDHPDPVQAGAVLTYTLVVSNAGPDPASAVMVTDILPVDVAYGGASGTGWSCSHVEGAVTCSRPSLDIGAAPSIRITVTAPAGGGIITNTATVSSQGVDPDEGSNRASISTQVYFLAKVYVPLVQR